jgi:hypothetical protein
MLGTVQERCNSRNGKPQLKIGGKYIYVGRCNIDGIDQGAYVEYETNTFGERNNLTGLLSIRLAKPANGSAPPGGGISPPSGFDGDELRFISNVVGSAIMAKSAASPTDVKGWALAAREALEALKSRTQPARDEHPFNDDLPPDESENPAPRGNW